MTYSIYVELQIHNWACNVVIYWFEIIMKKCVGYVLLINGIAYVYYKKYICDIRIQTLLASKSC